MNIKCYLAMTAAEFSAVETMPPLPAWMACHFSCYGTGLTNLPQSLPKGSMLIVNDRTPPSSHDPEQIAEQLLQTLEQTRAERVLLDFQRPDSIETAEIAKALTQALPCPVGVSASYAKDLSCPVFVCAPPPHSKLDIHLMPWNGREIWLEAATETEKITVTDNKSFMTAIPAAPLEDPVFWDEQLHCRYCVKILDDRAVFTLQRSHEEVLTMLEEAASLGVTISVGLYQQLGVSFP